LDKENERIEKEKQDALKARGQKRIQQLVDLGLSYDFKTGIFSLRFVMVAGGEVENEPDDKWEQIISDLIPNVQTVKREIQKEKDDEMDRLNKEAIERAEIERKQQDELRRQKERAELEEGDDLNRWVFFLKSLPKEFPVMQSRQYKKMIEESKEAIEIIKNKKATRS
jgi:hypothetical protein